MSTQEKIVAYVEGQPIPEPTECFAVRGVMMIDLVHPITGLTCIYGKTLEDCQADPDYGSKAERMTIEEFCQSKAAVQDTPIVWEDSTEEKFYDMLEVLPPRVMGNGGFLVGEEADHHALTGAGRYQAFIHRGGKYYASNRPLTVKEFKAQTLQLP
jgi:hypothetical protein